MWNCGTVLTRNRSLCVSTSNLATKDVYLKSHAPLAFRQRSLKTQGLPIHKHAGGRDLEKIGWNSILTTHNYQVFKYAKVRETSLKYLSTRRFHTSLTAYCADTKMDESSFKSSDTCKLNSDITNINLLNDDNTTHSTNTIADKSTASGSVYSKHKFNLKDIEKKYPNPKQSLSNIFQLVKNEKKSTQINYTYSQLGANNWLATLTVTWPEKLSFTGKSGNKSSAAVSATLHCLQWLEANKKIIKGKPQIYSQNEIDTIVNKPVLLSMKKETLNLAKTVLDKYEEKVHSIIQSDDNTLNIIRQAFQAGAIIDPVGNSNPANRLPEKIQYRNQLLQSRLKKSQSTNRSNANLPISQYRERIIEEIRQNNALVIKGDTGCGKTTQVPQFIMDSFAEIGQATDCNIIVSQPRRISAISLVERIANERMEQVGDVVGYQVRLSQELPNTPGGILFCTNGILLRKLQCNPTLEGCSHVIIDEAHERTINTDMLLALLKRAQQKRPTLKVIIMSATINAELFQNYFNCNVFEVPGRTFPVEMNFLEDIDKLPLSPSTKWDMTYENTNETGVSINLMKMGELIVHIYKNQPPGAILCFLPGWAEISKMKKYLEEHSALPPNKVMILPIHSKISHVDQRKIFAKPQPNVRKIVLATDIAETGITVTDVVYVVDSCTRKQLRWDGERHLSIIENQWASQANINQRKGRAGRIRPGISYHFITREQFDQSPQYPIPEIKCLSLEKTVLDAKIYSNEKAVDFLSSLPQPPPERTVHQAVEDLTNLGALDDNENLTPLGTRISFIALSPQLSKSLVYSVIFQCLSPIVTITSLMNGDIEIFREILQNKSYIRAVKHKFHPISDHLAVAWLFEQWYQLEKYNHLESRAFASKLHLNYDKLYTLYKIREINCESLYRSRMLLDSSASNNISSKDNQYAALDELCRGVLLCGVNNILCRRDYEFKKGVLRKGQGAFITDDGSRATITPDSVNFNRKIWPSPFLTHVCRTHSEQQRTSLIRDTSIVSPLTVFLFSQGQVSSRSYENPNTKWNSINKIENSNTNNNDVNNNINEIRQVLFTINRKKSIKVLCNKDAADVLFKFRNMMWNVVDYIVTKHGVTNINNDEYKKVDEFKAEMLKVLADMLREASEPLNDMGVHKFENDDQFK